VANITLDQKRLEALRRQLQGKTSLPTVQKEKTSAGSEQKAVSKPIATESTDYLGRDLKKILILSTAAVAFQLILFFSLNYHLFNLPI
jgi:hypothetical protein